MGGGSLHTRPCHVWRVGRPKTQTVSRETEVAGELSDPILPAHFFQFHPPVLEPYFDLPVSEVHTAADLQTALPCQVHVEEKLLLQLQSLVLGVGAAFLSPALSGEPVCCTFHFPISCDNKKKIKKTRQEHYRQQV